VRSGDVVVMFDDCQTRFQHAILKEDKLQVNKPPSDGVVSLFSRKLCRCRFRHKSLTRFKLFPLRSEAGVRAPDSVSAPARRSSYFRGTGVPHLQENAPPLRPYRRPMPRVLGGS